MAKFYQKNNLQLGIGIGLLLPAILFYGLHGIYKLWAETGNLQTNISTGFRERTIALLAIAIDIIPMRYYQKNRYWIDSMRGVTIAMAGLSVLWMVYFIPDLF